MKEKVIKIIVSLLLVGSYFFLPKYGFTSFCTFAPHIATVPITATVSNTATVPFSATVSGTSVSALLPHFLYPFSHANIWHLAANILCLWMLRCRMHLFATYLIAVLCSFLPSFSIYDITTVPWASAQGQEPTYGFSGILFAIVGISWGKIGRFKDMILRNKWFLIIPAFLPHVNFLIHIYCLLFGYLYGFSVCQGSASAKTKESCVRKSKNS